jgi:hypothetical protein
LNYFIQRVVGITVAALLCSGSCAVPSLNFIIQRMGRINEATVVAVLDQLRISSSMRGRSTYELAVNGRERCLSDLDANIEGDVVISHDA